MNATIQTQIFRVTKGKFINDKTGEVIEYGKVYIIDSIKNDENDYGLVIDPVSFDVKDFDKVKEYYKKGTKLNVEIEFIKQFDGKYRRKAVAFTEIAK